jgi:2-polyprenyl-3-methyl-5-hydroxy-6-metoxy-1,4-benzoquinol methylase
MTNKTKETKDYGDVIISSDFECGSGVSFQRLNINHFGIRIPADPPNPVGGDYKWYFCVRLANLSDTLVHLTLDAQRPGSSDIDWMASPVPVFVSEDFETWQPLLGAQMTPKYDYRLPITLNSGQAIYISNSLPHRYDAMCDWLRQIQTTHSGISRLTSLGQSIQGRDILCLTISETPDTIDTENDRILITSGTHPAEPDWLATTAIIEKLLSDESWARDARQKYIFDVIPQLNPDGFVLGTNGCNANGINPYWDFRQHDYKNSPETAYLWKWIEKHLPAIYLDFHCYVHNLNKDYQPYLKPNSDYHHPAIRRIVSELDNRLLMLSQGRAMRGKHTNLPSTLAYQITAKYDTITYTKYHLHLKHGIEHCRNLGLSVLKTIMEGIKPYIKISDLQIERTSKNFKWFLRSSARRVKSLSYRSKKRFKEMRNSFEVKRYWGTLWYEDVCKYFGISIDEAITRATSPNRQTQAIWKEKEKIETSEANVYHTWQITEDMIIRDCWYREKDIMAGYDMIPKKLNYKKGERILDYGCGVSSFTKWALRHGKFDITLADIDGPMLKFCKWRYGKRVSYCKICLGRDGLPLKEKYDIILCLDMLEHVWSPLDVVKHLYSHLNAQGRLIETFIDDYTRSNLRKANKERPLVLNYLNKHLKLISGSLDSAGPRIWMKEC